MAPGSAGASPYRTMKNAGLKRLDTKRTLSRAGTARRAIPALFRADNEALHQVRIADDSDRLMAAIAEELIGLAGGSPKHRRAYGSHIRPGSVNCGGGLEYHIRFLPGQGDSGRWGGRKV